MHESTRKTIVIVGASTGLGRATARRLAREHRVIVAGRDVAALRAAVPGAVDALQVDLSSLADAKRFGAALASEGTLATSVAEGRHGWIDALICNAGTQDTGAPSLTRDGLESTFAVNHLAHFAIVRAALPAFAPGARVVWIGSGTLEPDGARGFGFRGGLYTDARSLARGDGDPTVTDAQRAKDRYATSKLCDVLAMSAFAQREPGIVPLAFDPGLMPGTGLARNYSPLLRVAWHTVMPIVACLAPGMSSARRSARALAWLVTAPDAARRGAYVDYRRRELTWTGSSRTDWADDLYATSLELTADA